MKAIIYQSVIILILCGLLYGVYSIRTAQAASQPAPHEVVMETETVKPALVPIPDPISTPLAKPVEHSFWWRLWHFDSWKCRNHKHPKAKPGHAESKRQRVSQR